MNDKSAVCYVCGIACKDWNKDPPTADVYHYINCCGKHYQEIWNIAHSPSNPRINLDPNDGGFADSIAGMLLYADRLRIAYGFGQAVPIRSSGGFAEAPCKQCSRKNDIGNPKVKICWSCETPL